MLEKFASILQQNCSLRPEKNILVGVSGGGDSLCLLNLLIRSGYRVVAAHLNHGLRPEAAADAQFVEMTAGELDIPFILGKVDVPAHARQFGLSIEEAARNLRYTFLFEKALLVGAQAVAVAHHADDQVETILMHFLRGAGLSGLRGMRCCSLPNPWSEEIPLVRPLLEIWQEEIDTYLAEQKILPVEDATNRDTTIFRNRLRHELVPYLSTYNPGIRRAIFRMGQVLDADNELIEGMEGSAWEETYYGQGAGYLAFRFHALSIQPQGLQRRLFRKAISILRPGLRDMDFSTVMKAVAFLEAPTRSRRLELAAGLYLLLEEDLIWLADQAAVLPDSFWPQLPIQDDSCVELSLDLPGIATLGHGWVLSCQRVELTGQVYQQAVGNKDLFQAWIEPSQAPFPLSVRCRQPGDRFYPAGMAGKSVKVSDFMTNVKMPARARQNWPLVYSDEKLIWIPGYRLAEAALVSSSTPQVAHLHLFRSGEN